MIIPRIPFLNGILPFPFDLIVEWYIIIMVIVVSIIVLRRLSKYGYIRTIVLWKDGFQSTKDYKIKDGKLQIQKANRLKPDKKVWTPNIDSNMIIPPRKTLSAKLNPFGYKQKDIVLAVEGSPNCVVIKGKDFEIDSVTGETGIKKQITSTLFKQWTEHEVRTFLKKAFAQATLDRRLFKDSHFYIFVMILIMNVFVSILIANRIGVF